jgi:hypothetical protein
MRRRSGKRFPVQQPAALRHDAVTPRTKSRRSRRTLRARKPRRWSSRLEQSSRTSRVPGGPVNSGRVDLRQAQRQPGNGEIGNSDARPRPCERSAQAWTCELSRSRSFTKSVAPPSWLAQPPETQHGPHCTPALPPADVARRWQVSCCRVEQMSCSDRQAVGGRRAGNLTEVEKWILKNC